METPLEERQHYVILLQLRSHFGHSAVEADMEDAAWSILNALDDVK